MRKYNKRSLNKIKIEYSYIWLDIAFLPAPPPIQLKNRQAKWQMQAAGL